MPKDAGISRLKIIRNKNDFFGGKVDPCTIYSYFYLVEPKKR